MGLAGCCWLAAGSPDLPSSHLSSSSLTASCLSPRNLLPCLPGTSLCLPPPRFPAESIAYFLDPSCLPNSTYFHLLLRQIHRPFRKPLIVMAPKSLLRH